jgi:hypothetical protein
LIFRFLIQNGHVQYYSFYNYRSVR